MATDKKTVEKKDEPAVQAQVNEVAATVRKIVAVLERIFGLDIDRDGKIGSTRLGVLVCVWLTTVGLATAGTLWQLYDGDAVHGTAKITDDGAGTATLTVDAVAADVTGDLTGAVSATTISSSGAATLGDATTDVHVVTGVVTVDGSLRLKNGSTTNQISNGAALLDGEKIADDTIDDDSIDLSVGGGLSASDMPDQELGDIVISSGVYSVDTNAVGLTKLSTGVQTSLGKADTSVQPAGTELLTNAVALTQLASGVQTSLGKADTSVQPAGTELLTNSVALTQLASGVQTSLGSADSAYQPDGTDLLTEGYLDVLDYNGLGTNWLVFIETPENVTNLVIKVTK